MILGLIFFVIAAANIFVSYYWKKVYFLYGAISAFFVSLYFFMRFENVNILIYPLFFLTFTLLIYIFSFLPATTKKVSHTLVNAAYILFPNIIIFILLNSDSFDCYRTPCFLKSYTTILEALIPFIFFITAIIYGYGSKREDNFHLGYAASAFSLLGVLFLFKDINILQIQFYTITTGCYFLLLGYLTRKFHHYPALQQAFEYTGLATLLLVTTIESLLNIQNGVYYALILGIEGFGLILYGISLARKLFIYCGAAALFIAVFSQTYSFLFSIPQWAFVGIGGLIFIILAFSLLAKRKS